MKRGVRILLSVIFIILLAAADQLTKSAAALYLKGKPAFVLIPGVLELRYLENTGMAFSLLQNAQAFFYVVTAVLVVLIAWVWSRIPVGEKRYVPLRVISLFLEAGAIGNLIDRVMLHYVRDFIYISLINFPIFNVADMYVTVSVFFLILLLIFKYKDEDYDRIFKRKS